MKRVPPKPPVIVALLVMATLAFTGVGEAAVQDTVVESQVDMDAYIELLRMDYDVVKYDLIDDAMRLAPGDAAVFWPIYRQYEAERQALVDQRFEVIFEYSQARDTMTDTIAAYLAARSFAIERGRTDLKEKYFVILTEKLDSRKAARFIQAESQLEALVNLRLASEIPLID
jgi:endo-1,4-beta-mannosidase